MAAWRAGIAEAEITPPLGVSMTGYAGRPGPADHVLDPLFVRALALAAGEGQPVVLTSADLLGITDGMVAEIRRRVAEAVPASHLQLSHTHTHAGPTTAPLRCMGRADLAYCELVVERTVSVVRDALAAMRPARLGYGRSESGIGVNRREARGDAIVLGIHPSGPHDPTVHVLRMEDEAGRPLACWFSHATHPVVMGPQNTGISAEWPGAACAALTEALGCPALFAQGCCGDINPVQRGDHDVVVSVGRELAEAALEAWERAEPVPEGTVTGVLESASLPLRRPSPEEAQEALDEATARLERAQTAPERETAQGLLAWARDYVTASGAPPASQPMEVQALRIGDVLLAATAAETFSAIGSEMRRRSPLPRTVPLGYSNGCFGYLPTADAFPKGGYEITGAFRFYGTMMVTPECEALTLEAFDRAVARVAAGPAPLQ